MKRYYFTIASILVLAIGITSCSNEETKTQNQVAARPTVPIQSADVQIGTQVWMAKNLNVSRYRNGDPIPQVTNSTQWANLTTGAWCYYQNNSADGAVYGKLYNWYAVNDPRGLAPVGWHIPTDEEWLTLTTFLGGEPVAGNKMKARMGWNTPNTVFTNISGFTALPGGYHYNIGLFTSIGESGYWWSSSENGTNSAWYRYLIYDSIAAYRGEGNKVNGYSVRCVKNK